MILDNKSQISHSSPEIVFSQIKFPRKLKINKRWMQKRTNGHTYWITSPYSKATKPNHQKASETQLTIALVFLSLHRAQVWQI